MIRSNRRTLLAAAFVIAPALASGTGCVSLTANLMRMVYGNDIPPEYVGLKDQKIVIVCSDEKGYCQSDTTSQVSRGLQAIVTNKLRKATVVPQSRIDNWLASDAEGADVAPQIGRALEADVVILVDMRGMTLHDGATMYRGKSDITVELFDVEKGEVAFRKNLHGFTYPQNAAIGRTEMEEEKFQRIYLNEVAIRVSQLFVPSPMGSDIATDARLLNY